MANDSEPRKIFWGPLEAPSLSEVTFPGEKSLLWLTWSWSWPTSTNEKWNFVFETRNCSNLIW